MSAQDPFYYIKDQIDDSVNRLNSKYSRWQGLPEASPERNNVTRELIENCGSIERQVDELDRAITVAEKNPARFKVSPVEIAQRKKLTQTIKSEIAPIRSSAQAVQQKIRQSVRFATPAEPPQSQGWDISKANDDYIAAQSERQSLLLREQDEDLDELSTSIERIGGIGLTIHEELNQQERMIDQLGHDVDSTSNKLGYVQKKLEHVIRKAGEKGQLAMVAALVILLIVLVLLVFYF